MEKRLLFMEGLARKENEGLGEWSNGCRFVKRNTLRHRGGQDEPRGENRISGRCKK
jgi:hypothetical protein